MVFIQSYWILKVFQKVFLAVFWVVATFQSVELFQIRHFDPQYVADMH